MTRIGNSCQMRQHERRMRQRAGLGRAVLGNDKIEYAQKFQKIKIRVRIPVPSRCVVGFFKIGNLEIIISVV